MIERHQIEEMFEDMRTNPKASWSIDDACVWGYFFTDHDEVRLREAAPKLEQLGYKVVAIGRSEPDDDDPSLFWLQVQRHEKHTVDSLHRRNAELYRLAEEWGLESYDGMDVGPIEQTEV
ncbi:MAG TPA: ribonuclease E inhibitor RraB [Candidatus Eisenbacteria bacterium]|nr:ribonuclease E inhibitor RraB [Candidatus Eisenbacteria bacterium]